MSGTKRTYLLILLCLGLVWTGCEKESETDTPNEDIILQDNTFVVDSTQYNLTSTAAELQAGTYKFSFTGNAPDVVVGDIIVGAQDLGFLREVEVIITGTGQVTYQTSQASMTQLFKQGDIAFSMGLDSSTQFRSPQLTVTFPNRVLYNNNGITIELDGNASLETNLNFDFSFDDGALDKLVFETDNSNLSATITLSASANQASQLLNKKDTLAGFKKTFVKWVPVAGFIPVPIVVEVSTNFEINYGLNISGGSASVSFVNNNTFSTGVRYENNQWTGNNNFSPSYDIETTGLDGTIGASLSADITPILDVKFYKVIGPYASLSLKEEFKGNVSLSTSDWDFSASTWLEASLGINASIFNKTTLVDFSDTWSTTPFSYQTPYRLKKISGDTQTTTPNQALPNPIKVQVMDEFGNSQSNVPVYFSVTAGGGSSSLTSIMSDQDGYAEAVWTLGSTGVQTMSVSAKKADATALVGSPQIFTAQVDTSNPCVNNFPNLGTMTDARDGEVYETLTIGSQTWMAENLRYNAAGSWLNPANPCPKYGRLYDWTTVMNGSTSSSASPSGVQGICPSGWHLPSDAEWSTLEVALGMNSSDAATTGYRGTHGTGMKSTAGWNSSGNGTNASGFNAFPAGRYGPGSFYYLGGSTYFWSSTENSSSSLNACRRDLDYGSTGEVGRFYISKSYGYSCRCTRD